MLTMMGKRRRKKGVGLEQQQKALSLIKTNADLFISVLSQSPLTLTPILTRLALLYTCFYTQWGLIPLNDFSRCLQGPLRDTVSAYFSSFLQIFLHSQIKYCLPPEVCQACPSSQFSNPSLIYWELILPAWQMRKDGIRHILSVTTCQGISLLAQR